jgi:hypothetical protein
MGIGTQMARAYGRIPASGAKIALGTLDTGMVSDLAALSGCWGR